MKMIQFYSICMETWDLKKSSNVEIFEDIKKGFDELLALDEVVEKIKNEICNKYKMCCGALTLSRSLLYA